MEKQLFSNIVVLIAALLTVITHPVTSQQPTLRLFQGGGDEAILLVPVEPAEPYTLNFVTNTDTASLVTGSVESITVVLNGGSSVSLVERIEADAPSGTSLSTQAIDIVYEFRLVAAVGTNVAIEQYQSLVASLRYISSLPNTAFQEQRNISVVASGPAGDSQPSTAILMPVPSNLAPPEIQPRITVAVSENAADGTIFASINATDPEGLDVVFSFPAPQLVFSILPSGDLLVLDSDSLDYESQTQRRFELTVTATDTDPISPMSASATLIINVENANDNAPQFTESAYTFSVTEEVPNAIVGTIAATDVDQEPITNTIGNVFFDIISPSTEIIRNFNLNRGTGVISVLPPGLDFETVQSYTFQVQATDGVFTDTATVQVTVLDTSDNRPVISPAEKNILINLDTNQRNVLLTEGSGGQLMVRDVDSQFLQDGRVTLSVARSGSQVSILSCHTFGADNPIIFFHFDATG